MHDDQIVSSSVSDEDEFCSSSSANSYEAEHDAVEIDADEIDYSGPDAEALQRARIEEALVRCGITGRTLTLATLRIEALFHRTVMSAAGEGLAEVLAALGKTPTAEAIRRVVTHDKSPLRDAADKIGCSHEGLRKVETKIVAGLKGGS